jgi:hypothetical protein
VSPDGTIVFRSQDGQSRPTTILCGLPACASRRALTLPGDRPHWMPDGRAIAYVDAATQTNLWAQPLDGKRVAIARGTLTNDIVLFRGLKR